MRRPALDIPLTLKDVRYFERRPYPPGEHGRKRRTASDYSTRLEEKQRVRARYDISGTQLRRAFDRGRRSGGRTGEALITQSESRLDATALRAGFARTLYQARQTVSHQHVRVHGRRVDRPSYQVQPGDHVAIAERSKPKPPFQVAASGHTPRRRPTWRCRRPTWSATSPAGRPATRCR